MIDTKSARSTWKYVVCKDVIDVRDGTHDTPAQVGEGIPLVTSKNLKPDRIDFKDVTYISEADFLKIEKRSGVDDGDVLFAMIGTIGNPVIVRKDRRFAIKNVALFKLKESPVLPAFFKSLLSTETIRRQLASALRGGSQKFVSLSVLRNLIIPLPPLAEQRRIAEVMDRAEAFRGQRRTALAQLDCLTRSLFLDLFGDHMTILERWPTKKLGEILDFLTSGSRGWAKHYSYAGDLFLRIQNVRRDELLLDDIAYVRTPDTAEAKRTRVQAGDVLLSITADLGRTAVVPEGLGTAFINQHLSILRTKALVPRFLSAFFASPVGQRQVSGRNRQAVKAGLNFDDIRSFVIPIPPLELQREFVRRVTAVEKLKAAQRASLTEMDALFASLQHRAFRGEL